MYPNAPTVEPKPAVDPVRIGRRWGLYIAIACAGFVGALAAAGGILLLGHHNTPAAGTPSSAVSLAHFTVAGTLALDDGQIYSGKVENCASRVVDDDITEGAQVVIYDATGKTVAVASLFKGVAFPGGASGLGLCGFGFQIQHVPTGVGPYSVEVSHRGKIVFTEQEGTDGLSLTLGP